MPAALTRVRNPRNPWHATHVDWLGQPPDQPVRVHVDRSKGILSKNSSPDLRFTWSLNPYRGCGHACAYCYARPSHMHLDFGAGTDFDRELVVKPDAPRLLREAFDKRSWRGEPVVMSGNTDCYQPIEATYELTRQCLEVFRDYRNPVSIITKSALVERDVDLLAEVARTGSAHVTLSIPFADRERARAVEPGAASPARRFKAVRTLAEAGVPVGVNVAPIIPGLNDEEVPEVLERSREAGAMWAGFTMVRLPGPVVDVFAERIRQAFPLRADKILGQIVEARGGRMSDSRFGHRMGGQSRRWQLLERLFDQQRQRLGFPGWPAHPEPSTFQRPPKAGDQLDLFGG